MLSGDLDPAALVDVVRSEGSDVSHIEVKRATDDYPSGLAPTLSAFGSMPGGGVIIRSVARPAHSVGAGP